MTRNIKRIALAMTTAAIVSICWLSPAAACSTFLFHGEHGIIFGRNTDSGSSIPGLWIVNKRGVEKTAMPWGTFAPANTNAPTPKWVSRYGSVTVTAMGREFPDGGMNEAGLVVEEMTLSETVYPKARDGRAISHQQWIQYQLDNYATVSEVLDNLADVTPRGWEWHYMVADATGECATIEFIQGKAVVGRSVAVAGCVLTNNSLENSLAHLKTFDGFGGTLALPEDRSSLSRFVLASNELKALERGTGKQGMVTAGFDVLAAVAQGKATFRSIVHDIPQRKVYFRSYDHPSVKSIDLNRLDFAADSPVLIFAMESAQQGDVTGLLQPYSEEANRAAVNGLVSLITEEENSSAALQQELDGAGLTLDSFVSSVASYPSTTRPAK